MPKTHTEESWDSAENEVKSNWMKWNVSVADDAAGADKIHGTLIAKRTQKSTMAGKEGETQNVYDIKADEASTYHMLDENKKLVKEPIQINPGDIYSIGGNATIDRQMQNVKVGQVIGLKFIEEKPAKTKGYNPAKIIKVYAPKNDDGSPMMDTEFLAERENPENDAA